MAVLVAVADPEGKAVMAKLGMVVLPSPHSALVVQLSLRTLCFQLQSLVLRVRIPGVDGEEERGAEEDSGYAQAPNVYSGQGVAPRGAGGATATATRPAPAARTGASRAAAPRASAGTAYDVARRQAIARNAAAKQAEAKEQKPTATVPEVGRNDPCPCGSGKKYKKCHGS